MIEFSIYAPMRSASGEAAQHKYKLLTDETGRRWVVSVDVNAAENIYADGGPGSQGMGGRTLTFELEEGGTVALQGPWKTGAEALLKATRYDVRNTYYTQGIVARTRINSSTGKADEYHDVLHYDESPVMGSFDRVKHIAQAFADSLGINIPYGVRTSGGGSASWALPIKPSEQ